MGTLAAVWAVFLLLGMPVAFTLGVAALVVMWWHDMPLVVIAQRMTGGIDSFPLLAVPFFILAGNLMNTGGITDRIFHFSHALIGHMRGGLAQVNVIASVIFSGMSGSAVADAGGLGAMEIKAMREAGYRPAFAGAVTVASCIIGPLIPPSIPMVIYGVLADASVGRLFLGGVVPGLMTAGALMIMISIMARRQNFPVEEKATWRQAGQATRRALLPLLTPFIIIGGIVFGVFSPTEAAVIASLYAVILGLIYRELGPAEIWRVLLQSGRTTASICFIIATATVFAWLITVFQVPQSAARFQSHDRADDAADGHRAFRGVQCRGREVRGAGARGVSVSHSARHRAGAADSLSTAGDRAARSAAGPSILTEQRCRHDGVTA
jgi:tripartite ATP-independent transporter DctM subunit